MSANFSNTLARNVKQGDVIQVASESHVVVSSTLIGGYVYICAGIALIMTVPRDDSMKAVKASYVATLHFVAARCGDTGVRTSDAREVTCTSCMNTLRAMNDTPTLRLA